MRRIINLINDDGSIVSKEIRHDAAIVTPQNISAMVGDSGFPLTGEELVSVIVAATKRLEERIRYLEG